MSRGLRERLARLSDDGASFTELVIELDVHKGRMPPRQYDELWLFCWALAKRQTALAPSSSNGEVWPDVAA